jgi:phosphopantothenoylcysteine decarboxylase/phosphopantothenate--cysteine ligase
MPAAVSDFRMADAEVGKLSRSHSEELELKLVANPDLLAGLSQKRQQLGLSTILVGFAAEVLESEEDSDLVQRAQSKLVRKNVDIVVANDVTNGAVFDDERNNVVIVSQNSSVEAKGSKLEVANAILDQTIQLRG